MKLYAGIDLHGKNLVLALVDENDRLALKRRLPLFLGQILAALEPYRERIAGIAVESTYNWYWLVDGLADAGYEVKLVNTAAVPQYEGLKHRGDDEDARWLARLQHLGLLPTGWICPRETRSVRDLLRKRGQLVRQRTANVLSIQSQYARCGGWRIGGETAKRLRPEKIFEDFPDELQALAVFANSAVCRRLEDQIRMLEKVLSPKLEGDDDYRILTTMPGVGKILGMTIALETGDVGRFKSVPPSPLLRSGFGGRRAASADRGRLRLLLPLRPQRPGQRRKEEGGGKPAFAKAMAARAANHGDPAARHGPYPYWTTKRERKTVSRKLSEDEARIIEDWIGNRRTVEAILRQMNDVSERALELILRGDPET